MEFQIWVRCSHPHVFPPFLSLAVHHLFHAASSFLAAPTAGRCMPPAHLSNNTCVTCYTCHMSHVSHVTCVTCHTAIHRRLTSQSELHFGRGRGCHAAARSSQVTTLLLALALLSRASTETLYCSGNLRIVTRFFRGSDGVQLAQSRVRVFYDE